MFSIDKDKANALLQATSARRKAELEETERVSALAAAARRSSITEGNPEGLIDLVITPKNSSDTLSATHPEEQTNVFEILALTSAEEHAKLHAAIDAFLTPKLPARMDTIGSCAAIRQLYKSERTDITYFEILESVIRDKAVMDDIRDYNNSADMIAILVDRLKYLDEKSWMCLVVLYGSRTLKTDENEQYKENVYAAVSQFISDDNPETTDAQRFHALLFLRSLDQHHSLTLNDQLGSIIRKHVKDSEHYYQILTTFDKYENADSTLSTLFADRNFHFEDFYSSASLAFQALKQSVYMHLYAYYHTDDKQHSSLLLEPETRKAIKNTLSKTGELKSELELKLRLLDYILENNGKYIHPNDREHELVKAGTLTTLLRGDSSTAKTLSKEETRKLFAQELLHHLMNHGVTTPTLKEDSFFITRFHQKYLQVKHTAQERMPTKSASTYDKEKVDRWLSSRLDIVNAHELKAILKKLPDAFLEALFKGTSINPKKLLSSGGTLSSMFSSATNNNKSTLLPKPPM